MLHRNSLPDGSNGKALILSARMAVYAIDQKTKRTIHEHKTLIIEELNSVLNIFITAFPVFMWPVIYFMTFHVWNM